MRRYKVEALAFFPELTFDKERIVRTSQAKIQPVLDDQAAAPPAGDAARAG